MAFNSRLRSIIRCLFLLTLFAFSLIILLNTLTLTRPVQKFLTEKLSDFTQIDIKTGKMELHFFGGTGLKITDFSAADRRGRGSISASGVDLIFDTKALFTGRFIIVSLQLTQPDIVIDSTANAFSKDDPFPTDNRMIKGSEIRKISIGKGRIKICRGKEFFSLQKLDLDARKTRNFPFTMDIKAGGSMEFMGESSPFKLEGKISSSLKDRTLRFYNTHLHAEKTPLSWLKWPKFIQMKQGTFNPRLRLDGEYPKNLSIGGTASFEFVKFDYTLKEKTKDYRLPELTCSFDSKIAGRKITANNITVKKQGITLNLNLLIDLEELANPFLDLSIESEFMAVENFKEQFPWPVAGTWLHDDLFPILESGDVRIDLLKMKGRISQFIDIRMPENYSILEMVFDCRNFRLSGEGIQVPFSDVFTRIDLTDGDFHVNDLKGRFGDSVIDHGALYVHQIMADSAFYEISLNGVFDIHELLRQRTMRVIPQKATESLNIISDSRGRMECSTRIGYKNEWKIPRILEGTFRLKELDYHENILTLPLRFNEIEFHTTEENSLDFSGEGTWGNSPFAGSGSFGIEGEKIANQKAHVKGLMDMNQCISIFSEKDNFPFYFAGPVPWEIEVINTDGLYDIRGTADTENLVMESKYLIIAPSGENTSMEYSLSTDLNGAVNLKNVLLKAGSSSIMLSGGYDPENASSSLLNLDFSNLNLIDMGIHAVKGESILQGNIEGALQILFTPENRSKVDITGNIEGSKISLQWPGLFVPLNDSGLRLEFTGQETRIKKGALWVGESPLSVTGTIRNWNPLITDLTLESDYFDLTDIIMNKCPPEEKIPFSDNPLFESAVITMNVNFIHGIWRRLEYHNLEATLGLERGVLRIENAKTGLKHGTMDTIGFITTGRNRKLGISGNVYLKDQPVDLLMNETGIEYNGLKGDMTINGSYVLKASEGENLLNGLSAEIQKFEMTEGLVRNSGIFLKILDMLNIPDKFRKRPSEASEEGFYFRSLAGSALIKSGILETDDFILKSPAFNAVGSGSENLAAREHDFMLLVQPLGNLDYVLSHLPIIGNILVGEEETIFSLGYEVKGPWNRPELKIAPIENVKGLFGVLKRAFFTPANLYNGIKKAATGKEEEEVTRAGE